MRKCKFCINILGGDDDMLFGSNSVCFKCKEYKSGEDVFLGDDISIGFDLFLGNLIFSVRDDSMHNFDNIYTMIDISIPRKYIGANCKIEMI